MSPKGHLEIKTSPFVWKIDNFNELIEGSKEVKIESPIFEVSDGMLKKSRWQIMLVIPDKEDTSVYLYLSFLHDNANFLDDNYCFTFSLLDNFGKKVVTSISNVHKFDAIKVWGRQIIKKSDITCKKDSLFAENILSVFCEISMNVYSFDEVYLKSDLYNVYESFYLNEKFSDVTIKCDKEEIKAHKMVLSAKSQVFAAMLEHDMKEKNMRTIEINDISLNVIKELLFFMYCGKINNLKEIAESLLIAADKYDVSLLKLMCEKSMRENLKVENACETLVTSDLYTCKKLKTETIDFIIENITKLAKTTEFMELKKLNPKLLEEILQRIAEQKELENSK